VSGCVGTREERAAGGYSSQARSIRKPGGGGGKTVLVPGVETRCNKGKDGSQLVV